MDSILKYHLISFMVAMIGFVYAFVLTEPYMILEKISLFLESKLPYYLYKPIIGCERCVTGQIALWVFLILFVTNSNYSASGDLLLLLRTFFLHTYYICLSIFICVILKKVYSK